ncbi:MAG: hypothetical protein ABSA67_14330 [Candidatus Brocadiia bacterium]|jgi:hypothetical protein
MPHDAPLDADNHRAADYAGPERRRCPPEAYCINLSRIKIEFEGFKQKASAEYAALERLVGELRELVVALPKEVAAQIAKERSELDRTLDKGGEDFKEIFRRLAKLEKAVLAVYIIVALVIVGKGLAWFLGLLHIL